MINIKKENELFELSKVFARFQHIKDFVIFNENLMTYIPVCEIKNKDFKRIESDLYYLKACWDSWKEAKVQAVPQWISVEDKLPPENILVLAMSQTISNVFNVYNVMALDEFEESNITHWMPLPPAPEAQEANQ